MPNIQNYDGESLFDPAVRLRAFAHADDACILAEQDNGRIRRPYSDIDVMLISKALPSVDFLAEVNDPNLYGLRVEGSRRWLTDRNQWMALPASTKVRAAALRMNDRYRTRVDISYLSEVHVCSLLRQVRDGFAAALDPLSYFDDFSVTFLDRRSIGRLISFFPIVGSVRTFLSEPDELMARYVIHRCYQRDWSVFEDLVGMGRADQLEDAVVHTRALCVREIFALCALHGHLVPTEKYLFWAVDRLPIDGTKIRAGLIRVLFGSAVSETERKETIAFALELLDEIRRATMPVLLRLLDVIGGGQEAVMHAQETLKAMSEQGDELENRHDGAWVSHVAGFLGIQLGVRGCTRGMYHALIAGNDGPSSTGKSWAPC